MHNVRLIPRSNLLPFNKNHYCPAGLFPDPTFVTNTCGMFCVT